MLEVDQLDYLDYLFYRREAFIWTMAQTEEGLDYLNNAYRLSQTEPDRKSLREQFGKGE